MNLATATSINNVPVRLTEERWDHINDSHPEDFTYSYHQEILDTVEFPTYILQGRAGSLIAVVPVGKKRFLHVIYRELSAADGFIVTAFYQDAYDKDLVIWRAEDQQ